MKTRTRILKTIWLVVRWPVGTVAVITGLVLLVALIVAMLSMFGSAVLHMINPSCHVGFWTQAAIGGSTAVAAALLVTVGVNFGFFVREKWEQAGR